MSTYRKRLEEERKHLTDDAVIERALLRIDDADKERTLLIAENEQLRSIVEALAAEVPDWHAAEELHKRACAALGV
jgi:chromosome condensin MukBEF ATPase and DNA-binding subunit MukB